MSIYELSFICHPSGDQDSLRIYRMGYHPRGVIYKRDARSVEIGSCVCGMGELGTDKLFKSKVGVTALREGGRKRE